MNNPYKVWKQPDEKFYITVDFSNALGSGEVIDDDSDTTGFTAMDKDDNDKTTTILDLLTQSFTDSVATVQIINGLEASAPYKITCKVETSISNIFELDINLNVLEI